MFPCAVHSCVPLAIHSSYFLVMCPLKGLFQDTSGGWLFCASTTSFNEEFRARCVVSSSTNAWMNQTLTEDWVDKVIGKFSFARRFLTWDSFACHLTDSVKEKLAKSKVDVVVVPGGCTK